MDRKYLLTQGLYSVVTFAALMVGLPVIGLRNWIFVALGFTVLDLIPVLGFSAGMLGLAVYELAGAQNRRVGLNLLLLYVIVMILQQILDGVLSWSNAFGVTPCEIVVASLVAYGATGLQPYWLLTGPLVWLFGKKILYTFFEPRNGRRKKGYFNRGFSRPLQSKPGR